MFTYEWDGDIAGNEDEITSDIADMLNDTQQGNELWAKVDLDEQA